MRGAWVAAGVLLAACTAQPPPSSEKRDAAPVVAAPASIVGAPLPAFTAERAGGGMFTSAELRNGRWTVIGLWAAGEETGEEPFRAALAQALAQDPGVQFVTVHVGAGSGAWPSVQAYMAEKRVGYPVLLDPERAIAAKLQMGEGPTYVVVDPDGIVRAVRPALSKDGAPEGGVKALAQELATLRRTP
jgi:nucleotide-binding universal stress UspA family protein